VSVCRISIETAERLELVFGVEASFYLSYSVLKGNLGISKNKGVLYFPLELCSKLPHIDRRDVLST